MSSIDDRKQRINTLIDDRNRAFLAQEVEQKVEDRKFKERLDKVSGGDITLENPLVKVFALVLLVLIVTIIVNRI